MDGSRVMLIPLRFEFDNPETPTIIYPALKI
jgi:hypothetical protein